MTKNCAIKIRVSQSDLDQLNQLSQAIHRSRSEAVRTAIKIACSLFTTDSPPIDLVSQSHTKLTGKMQDG